MRNLLLALGLLACTQANLMAQNFGAYQANYGPYGSSYSAVNYGPFGSSYSASSINTNAFGTRGSFTLGYNNGYPYNYRWYYPYPRVIAPVYPVVVQPVVPVYAPLNPLWNAPGYGFGYGNYPNYTALRNPWCGVR